MRYKIYFDIVKNRKKYYTVSSLIIVIGLISLLIWGLNLGVDFKAGTTLDISLGKSADKAKVEQLFTEAGQTPASITIGGTNSERVTARFDKVLNEQEVINVMDKFAGAYGDQISKEENTVDTELAKELARKAIYGVLIACLGIALYVTIRFEWRFALAAVITTLYDAILVVGFFSIFRWEVNLPFVAAVLTIVGYSINDTIIIFDRIRENMRFAKLRNKEDLMELVNRSVWQTMTRSINTVITVLFGAVCLFVFGSESIRLFSLAMIIGLCSGAYSSIFIASTIWFNLKAPSLGRRTAPQAK